MKKLIYKSLIAIAILVGGQTVNATTIDDSKDYTKELEASFDVDPGSRLDVQNKYGDINITTWSNNQIKIHVLIKVKTDNERKAENALENIDIILRQEDDVVVAHSEFNEEALDSKWWQNIFGGGDKVNFEIHYTIKMPERTDLVLANKYGNISCTDMIGSVNVYNKYGDIFFGNIQGNLTLENKYGNSTTGNVEDARVEIKYGGLTMDNFDDLNLQSGYSKVKIGDGRLVRIEGKYDHYDIGKIRELRNEGKYDSWHIDHVDVASFETKYSGIVMEELGDRFRFEGKYSNVKAKRTSSRLSEVLLEGKSTDFTFYVSGNYEVQFEGDHADINLTSDADIYHDEKDGDDRLLEARKGTNGAKFRALLKYGGLYIK